MFEAARAFYERTLHASLRHRVTVLVVAGLMAVLTIGLVMILPQGFIPTDDTGMVLVFTEAAQDISFEEMVRHQQAAAPLRHLNRAKSRVSCGLSSWFPLARSTLGNARLNER